VKSRRLRGQVLLAQGQLAEAEQELSIALEVAQKLGNPSQLWKNYAVLGDGLSVIEEVASGLKDKSLRDTFINSLLVQEIRHEAQGER
jgi:hypothetical protein